MKPTTIATLVLVLAAGGAAGLFATDAAAVLPGFVVKDNLGNVVGPFAGLDSRGTTVPEVGFFALLTDPDDGNFIPLRYTVFGANQFVEGLEFVVYYEFAGCTGKVYLRRPEDLPGAAARALGRSYGVGPGAAGELFVFRVRDGETAASVMYGSSYADGSCDPPPFPLSASVVEADAIINLNAEAPLPWTLE